jgi:hypothetical protein
MGHGKVRGQILISVKGQTLILVKKAMGWQRHAREGCGKKVARSEILLPVRAIDFGQLYFGWDRLTSR